MLKISDLTPTATQDGHFTDGSVAAGVSPTLLMAAWFNAVQDELINLLTSQGVVPNPQVSNQLAQVIFNSPVFTGAPKVPDMDKGNYGEQAANSRFVRDAINVLIGGAPENLNTLGELAQAMGNDPAFLTNVNNGLATLGNAITGIKADVGNRMSKSANGSDIADKVAFLSNIGAGTAATKAVGNGAGQIPDMSFFTLDAGQTGGAKLPGGLMFQWGVTPSTTGTISAAFKTPFPNACLWVGKNTYSSGSSATSTSVIEIVSPTKSGFTMSNIATLVNNNTAVAGPVNAGIAFFAIGW
ncbi:gp53-like domain-containing protein [Pantoea ananatis]|uniref:gp53-like domain-containing protein n=1 Tax=Pantoea ananas TaxID=553 RepID=UPI003C21CA44